MTKRRYTRKQDAADRAALISILQEALKPAFDAYAAQGFTPLEDLSTIGTIFRLSQKVVKQPKPEDAINLIVTAQHGSQVTCCYLTSLSFAPKRPLALGEIEVPEPNSPFMTSCRINQLLALQISREALWGDSLEPIARIPELAKFLAPVDAEKISPEYQKMATEFDALLGRALEARAPIHD
ncbi:TPA: hypothetical protein DEP96_01155 [Candidatus Uhrbacteria bacterium]|nr:hypothetical protein [Candidatus Uhrbacteria bacterium]